MREVPSSNLGIPLSRLFWQVDLRSSPFSVHFVQVKTPTLPVSLSLPHRPPASLPSPPLPSTSQPPSFPSPGTEGGPGRRRRAARARGARRQGRDRMCIEKATINTFPKVNDGVSYTLTLSPPHPPSRRHHFSEQFVCPPLQSVCSTFCFAPAVPGLSQSPIAPPIPSAWSPHPVSLQLLERVVTHCMCVGATGRCGR